MQHQAKVGETTLISDKLNFTTRNITRDRSFKKFHFRHEKMKEIKMRDIK